MTLAIDPTVGVEVASDAVERAARAGATGSKATHTYQERFEVNYETGAISLIRSTVADNLSITVYMGDRKGSADVTGRDHDLVEEAVAQAVTAALAGQPDPANVLPEEPAEPAADRGDQAPDKEAMVDVVARFVEELGRDHPTILTRSSSYTFDSTWSSYANSHGRVQHARRGRYIVGVVASAREEKSSTSFQYTTVASADPVADIGSVPAVDQTLVDLERSFGARPVPATFVGEMIVAPQALASLMASVAQALGGLALLRKASPFLDRLGDKVASPLLSLAHRPSRLAGAAAFDSEGFPNSDLDVISAGVLEHFLIDWYTSHKLGRPRTTGLADLEVGAGDTALEDIIATTDRGILMGRFSGGMPNQNLDFSGVAKNSFYVEGGRVVGPVNETMVAGNLVSVLRDLRAISSESIDFGYYRMPWMATSGVTISTK